MRVTIETVAQKAGVSTSTVSRVLSGKGKISPETAERVRRVAEELNYVPRRYIRREQAQEGGTVLLLISGFHELQHNSFYSQIAAGVEAALGAANYRLLLKTLTGNADEERAVIDDLVSAQDGVVLVGYEVDLELIRRIKQSGKPFVLVDNDCWSLNIDCVTNDNLAGTRRLMHHLIGLGHTRIGFIGGPHTHVSLDERYNGYKQALKQARLPKPSDCIAFSTPRFDTDQGYQVAMKMLRSVSKLPTAIFAANDLLAIGVLKAARDLGLRVPEDLSVAGFDDVEMARHMSPSLTTVRVHKYEMGLEAGKRLLDLLRGEVTKPIKIVLSTELLIRQSTAAPATLEVQSTPQHTA